MNKLLLYPLVLSMMLMAAAGIAPVYADATTGASLPVGVTEKSTSIQIDSTQSQAPANVGIAHLDEASVSFLLACRCTPDKLPW